MAKRIVVNHKKVSKKESRRISEEDRKYINDTIHIATLLMAPIWAAMLIKMMN